MSTRSLRIELLQKTTTGLVDNLRPFDLALTEHPNGESVPVHSGALPARPTVYLQVWTRGREEVDTWQGPAVLALDPGLCSDLLCAEIPGWVLESEQGLRFQPAKDPVLGTQGPQGFLSVCFRPGDAPQMVPLAALGHVPTVRVALVLRTQPQQAQPPAGDGGLQVLNLVQVLGAQMAEGGLTLGFHVTYTGVEKVKEDLGFLGWGRLSAAMVHSLTLNKHGELVVGTSPMRSTTPNGPHPDGLKQLCLSVLAIRRRVAELLFGGDLARVKVKRLYTLTHGLHSSMMVGAQYHWIRLKGPDGKTIPQLEEPLKELAQQHLCRDAVWAQFSCNVSGHPSSSKNGGDFGVFKPTPTAKLLTDPALVGEGSFSDYCRKRLDQHMDEAQGPADARGLRAPVGRVAVWGHTSKGSALLNQEMRAFTRQGNMDLCYMMDGLPRTLPGTYDRVAWSDRFMNALPKGSDPNTDCNDQPRCWQFVYLGLSHPGALIQRRLEEWRGVSQGVTVTPGAPAAQPPAVSVNIRVEQNVPPPAPSAKPPAGLVWPPGPGALLPAAPPSPVLGREPNPDRDGRVVYRLDSSPGARRGGRAVVQALPEVPGGKYSAIEVRDDAILAELRAGNMPDFCRAWVKVPLHQRGLSGCVYVQADVLAVGINEDYVRVNLSGISSERLATGWGCFLPTRRILQGVLLAAQAGRRVMHNMDCQTTYKGMHQLCNAAMLTHDDIVQGRLPCGKAPWPDQTSRWKGRFNPLLPTLAHKGRCTIPEAHPGTLFAGHKKEVCLRHNQQSGKPSGPGLNFYGFPIKADDPDPNKWKLEADGFGSIHGSGFTDYAQGTRLVYPLVEAEGEVLGYAEALQHERYWELFSDQRHRSAEAARYDANPKTWTY